MIEAPPKVLYTRNPDGETTKPATTREGARVFEPAHWPAADECRPVDALLALQLGIWPILTTMKPWSFDILEFLKSGRIESRKIELKVSFDWARPTQALEGGMVTIGVRAAGAVEYGWQNLENIVLEDTHGTFGEGTVLVKVAHARTSLVLEAWLATKDDRAGVRRALEDALLGEPDDARGGRRVCVDAYYRRVGRYTLLSIDSPDDEDSAQANHWVLRALVDSDIDVVRLVRAPAEYVPRFTVDT